MGLIGFFNDVLMIFMTWVSAGLTLPATREGRYSVV
jgi:hypothetical protein